MRSAFAPRLLDWEIAKNLRHRQELDAMIEQDQGLKLFLEEQTKICPHCFQTIER